MEMEIFAKGLMVGFFLCAPLGPIGIFCARRTLSGGAGEGVAAVLGASTVDFIYCTMAGLGVTFLTTFIQGEKDFLRIAGALVFVLLGIGLFFKQPEKSKCQSKKSGLLGAYTSTFLITLANPLPMMVFTATFAALGLQGWREEWVSVGNLVLGVTIGSALWSPVLVAAVCVFRREFRLIEMRLVNKVSGVLIFAFGMVVGCHTLMQ